MKANESKSPIKHILLFGLLAVTIVAAGCEGCGEQGDQPADSEKTDQQQAAQDDEEQASETPPEDQEPAVDLEEATKTAKNDALTHAVKVTDQSRLLAAELEGAQAERQEVPKTRSGKKKSRAAATGTIDTRALLKVFNKYEGELKKCYERALKRDPNLAGKISLQVRIEPSGRASTAKVTGTSMRDASMFGCMERSAKSWSYPTPTGGAAVVNKPITFSPDM